MFGAEPPRKVAHRRLTLPPLRCVGLGSGLNQDFRQQPPEGRDSPRSLVDPITTVGRLTNTKQVRLLPCPRFIVALEHVEVIPWATARWGGWERLRARGLLGAQKATRGKEFWPPGRSLSIKYSAADRQRLQLPRAGWVPSSCFQSLTDLVESDRMISQPLETLPTRRPRDGQRQI